MKKNLRNILNLSVPAMLSSISGLMATLVCIRIMGGYDSMNYYLFAAFLPIQYIMLAIYEAIRSASLALSSPLYGKSCDQLVVNMIALCLASLIIFLILYALFFLLSPYLISAVAVIPGEIETFTRLTSLMILSGSVTCISYVFSSTFFATKQPYLGMNISLLSAGLVCVLTYLLSAHIQPAWVAYALSLLLASFLSVLVSLSLLKQKGLLRLSKVTKQFDSIFPIMQSITKIASPVLVAYLFIFSSLSFVNSTLSYFDLDTLSGYGIAYRIQNIVLLPAIMIGTAIAILSGKARVEKNLKEERRIHSSGLICCFCMYIVIALLVYVFRHYLLSLVTMDPRLIAAGDTYLKYVSITYMAMGPNLTYLTALEQSGFGVKSLLINVLYFIVAVAVGCATALYFHQYTYLYITIGASNLLIFLYLLISFFSPAKGDSTLPSPCQGITALSLYRGLTAFSSSREIRSNNAKL